MSNSNEKLKPEKEQWTIIDTATDPNGPISVTVNLETKTRTIENCPEPKQRPREKIIIMDTDKLAEKLITAGIIKDKSEITRVVEL